MTFASEPSATSDPLAGKRILIVEDEGITQMQLLRVFKRAGLVVTGSANNGQAGVDLALRERPDLVMLDMNMPGMSGLEAARLILAEYTPCVVFLTAYNEAERKQQAQEVGAHGYLVKPILAEQLLPQLRTAWQVWQTALYGHLDSTG